MNTVMFVLMIYFPSYSAVLIAHHNSVPVVINGFHTMEACEDSAEKFRKQQWPAVKAAICYALPTGATK